MRRDLVLWFNVLALLALTSSTVARADKIADFTYAAGLAMGVAPLNAKSGQPCSAVSQNDKRMDNTRSWIGTAYSNSRFAEISSKGIARQELDLINSRSRGGNTAALTDTFVAYQGVRFDLPVHTDKSSFRTNSSRAELPGALAATIDAEAICGAGNQEAHLKDEALLSGISTY